MVAPTHQSQHHLAGTGSEFRRVVDGVQAERRTTAAARRCSHRSLLEAAWAVDVISR